MCTATWVSARIPLPSRLSAAHLPLGGRLWADEGIGPYIGIFNRNDAGGDACKFYYMEEKTMEGIAKGKVCVGFSYPLVGLYGCAAGVVSITKAQVLARGVSVDISVNLASDNEFYADNVLAESETDVFESGSMKLTVDGLMAEARRFISGQDEPKEVTYGESKVKLAKYGTTVEKPYIAVGVIVKYKSNRKDIWQPYVFPKTKFKTTGLNATTQGKTTSWQTEDIETTIHRADTAEAEWKWEGEEFATEGEAKAALNAIFGLATA